MSIGYMSTMASTRRNTAGVLDARALAGSVPQSTMKLTRCATLTSKLGTEKGSTAVASTSTTCKLTPSIETLNMEKALAAMTWKSVVALRDGTATKSCCCGLAEATESENRPFTQMAFGTGSSPPLSGDR